MTSERAAAAGEQRDPGATSFPGLTGGPGVCTVPFPPQADHVRVPRRSSAARPPTSGATRLRADQTESWTGTCVHAAGARTRSERNPLLENCTVCQKSVHFTPPLGSALCRETRWSSNTDSGQLCYNAQLFSRSDRCTAARLVSVLCARVSRCALHPRIVRRLRLKVSNGEFDPGSGRTLAARLTHASRGRTGLFGGWGDRRTGE